MLFNRDFLIANCAFGQWTSQLCQSTAAWVLAEIGCSCCEIQMRARPLSSDISVRRMHRRRVLSFVEYISGFIKFL